MRFVIVDTYYDAFLRSAYQARAGLSGMSYSTQWRAVMDLCFGTADYYSANLSLLGHEATELIANCGPLQRQWARENGMRLRRGLKWRTVRGIPVPRFTYEGMYEVLKEQIRRSRPDVVHFQDPAGTDPRFVREIRPFVRAVTAQIASPIPPSAEFGCYDLMLSSFPHFVRRFKDQGLRSEYFRLGFDPKILSRLAATKTQDVVFVGGISSAHGGRTRLFEYVARQLPIEWWGYGVESLDQRSPLHRAFRGPAWGLQMYDKLHNARVSLNMHVDVAADCANNMRLYEATGVGSCLITDHKTDMQSLFDVGKEALVYRSPDECVETIRYCLQHDDQRRGVAVAGQQRTLREHTYRHRMEEFVNLVRTVIV